MLRHYWILNKKKKPTPELTNNHKTLLLISSVQKIIALVGTHVQLLLQTL